jgi:hypothetical protein
LFFDALEGSDGNIPLRVDYRHTSWLDRMLELLVAARLGHLEPVVGFEPANHFPAVHRGFPVPLKNTHFVYTDQ